MSLYGVVDIGSNTVVLLVYGMNSGKPEIIRYESEPVHLVSYIKDGHMQAAGIEKTAAVVKRYQDILNEYDVTARGGFVTEPWRGIDNSQEMLDRFRVDGLEIVPLTGRQEAEYDFLGSRLDCSDILTGKKAAFHIYHRCFRSRFFICCDDYW